MFTLRPLKSFRVEESNSPAPSMYIYSTCPRSSGAIENHQTPHTHTHTQKMILLSGQSQADGFVISRVASYRRERLRTQRQFLAWQRCDNDGIRSSQLYQYTHTHTHMKTTYTSAYSDTSMSFEREQISGADEMPIQSGTGHTRFLPTRVRRFRTNRLVGNSLS